MAGVRPQLPMQYNPAPPSAITEQKNTHGEGEIEKQWNLIEYDMNCEL